MISLEKDPFFMGKISFSFQQKKRSINKIIINFADYEQCMITFIIVTFTDIGYKFFC